MKKLIDNIGLFFKGIGTKIAGWSLALKITVPVATLVVTGTAVTVGIVVNKPKASQEVAATLTEESESVSESESETETETETYETQMVVDIQAPERTDCWVAYSSIEKDLNLYVLDSGNNKAITGRETSIKLMKETQASGLWDSIYVINSVQELINQAIALETEGTSTADLEKKIMDAGKIDLNFKVEDVIASSNYVAVDSKGNIVKDAKPEEAKGYQDLTPAEQVEFDKVFAISLSKMKLSEKLEIYKGLLAKQYAAKVAAIEAPVYTDDNLDGVYYISDLEAGRYYACLVPIESFDPKEYAVLSVVKEQIEYVKVEHIEAEVVEDESKEPEREESVKLEDTVKFVNSSSKKNLPEYAKASEYLLAPVVAASMSSAETITIYQAPATTLENESESESESESSQEESESQEEEGVEYSDVLQITSGVSFYPVDLEEAKLASLHYVIKSDVVLSGENGITVTVLKEDKTTTDSNWEASLSENGTIALTMKTIPAKGSTSYLRLKGKYATYNSEAGEEEQKEIYVDCKIQVYDASKKILDKEGHELYLDKEHFANNRTALTVGTFDKSKEYYYETKPEYMTYYGWQNLNGQRYYFDENGKVVTGEQVVNGTRYNFGGDGILLTAGTGVDVSKWQGKINWQTLASQVSFAIIKCGGSDGGRYEDDYFRKNIEGVKETNLAYGLYFFCWAKSEADAIKDASLAIELANSIGSKFALPIYCDYEGTNVHNQSVEQNTKNVLAFCKTIESAGYKAGVYSGAWIMARKLDATQLEQYSIWVADYSESVRYYTGPYDIWQYSSSGDGKQLGASSERIDMNQSYFN